LHFGMTSKAFYAVCWDLNKSGVLQAGSGNLSAAYDLDKGELAYPAKMSFYPQFVDGKISRMPVRFSYISWAPWNRELQSDKLLLDVAKLMEKWYGTGFFSSTLSTGGKGLVKIDGNRSVIIKIETESDVVVTITDLTVK
jgi:hypothetical protein